MIRIIGTHHFMKREEIEKEIDNYKPDIILLELCKGRIFLIDNPTKEVKNYSLLGLIARAVKKKGTTGNVEYGNDMVSAYKIAKERNIKVGLIDRPIVETQILFKAIPLKEKIKLFKQLLKFSSKKTKVEGIINEVNNNAVQDIVDKLKIELPNLHYFLIKSRDEYIIAKTKGYIYDYTNKKIIAFVGKGHLKTLEESLKGGQND